MLYIYLLAVFSENRTKHTNELRGQNAEFFNAKLHGTWEQPGFKW
jgi:hypothetical protein